MEVVLLQSAQADLLQVLAREGDDMYHIVDAALEKIRRSENIGPIYHGQFRRKLVVDTPYGIFYSVAGQRIMVSFIMDLRQDPKSILQRLKN